MKFNILLVVVFAFTLLLTFIARKIAVKKSILDIPNERSSHKFATPRGGGIAVTIIWFIGISYTFFFQDFDHKLYYALISGVILVLVGVVDDYRGLKPGIRLFFQIITVIIAFR